LLGSEDAIGGTHFLYKNYISKPLFQKRPFLKIGESGTKNAPFRK
jgi:hypothetical protein